MAEGIKISEMEQVTTLEDGCCFPVVSNGENKKITFNDLKGLVKNYNGVEIHTLSINESANSWTLISTGSTGRTKTFTLPTNAVILEDGWHLASNKGVLSIDKSTDKKVIIKVSNETEGIYVKGYVEYVIF